jgi:hypothetical protein
MARTVAGSLCLVVALSLSATAQQKDSVASHDKELKLCDCKVYVHASSGTLIAVCDSDQYYGSPEHVTPFVHGDATQKGADGTMTIKFSHAKSDGKPGLLVYCPNGNRFYAVADDAAWAKMPKGKDSVAKICSANDLCSHEAAICESPVKPASNPAAKSGQSSDAKIVQAGARFPTAPGVTLIEGERVRPEEAMVFTRSLLLEEGSIVAAMNHVQENINNVRYNMNTYRLGYALPATKTDDRYQFTGAVKGWRAASTGDVSVWPPMNYRTSRDEAMRRAKLLQPIAIAEEIPEMANLRVYYLPSLVGHDGRRYKTIHQVLAFFIHPKTGHRMTVLMRDGRTYGTVNKPLAATSRIFISDAESRGEGPLGIVTVYIPSVFYSKKVDFDMEPFAAGDNFDRLMNTVLEGHLNAPLATDDFLALYNEMTRYTGGKTE